MHRRILYQLTWLAAALSLGHHLDHLICHNAVGWPLTDQVNAFTISLGVYPVIATGLLAYRAGRVGPGSWALVSGGGAIFVGVVHFGPAAVEPPQLILGPTSRRSWAGWPSPGWWRLWPYQPGSMVAFRFTGPQGLHGQHRFEVLPEIGGCRLRHVLEGHTTGRMRLLWPLLYRPLHDALIEDSLDRAEHAVCGRTHQAPRPWSLPVRMLRRFISIGLRRRATRRSNHPGGSHSV